MPPVRSATSRSTRSVRGIGRGRDLAPDLRDGQLRQRQKRRVDVGEKVGSLVGVKDGKEYEIVVTLGSHIWIGRNALCDFVVPSERVSLYHLRISAVRTSSTQVIVSVQDFSTNGFLLNGAHRDPQAKVKVRNTMTSSRSQVLRDGDVLALPNTPFSFIYHQRRRHMFRQLGPDDMPCSSSALFRFADPSAQHAIGPWVINNYPLGHGAFGFVHLAHHKNNQAVQVACKTTDASSRQDIQHEIDLLKNIVHANVCGILDTAESDMGGIQRVHVFMPLVLGGDLFAYAEKHHHFTEDEVRFAAKQLLEGLAYLHKRKIAHKDIKPENILLRCSAAYPHLLLADFGLATTYEDVLATVPAHKVINCARSYSNLGTLQFTPPEQLSGALGRNKGTQGWGESIRGAEWRVAVANKWFEDDMGWDKWSLGIVLYQLLAGFHPYDHSNDEDAPGEELDPEAQAQERRKLTAAKSWDEFRSQNGGGAMRVGETKRDRETSRMLAAAEKFVSQGVQWWYPGELWVEIDIQGRNLIKSLTERSVSKRPALASLLTHGWFKSVEIELEQMYDTVVRQGRLPRGAGSKAPGLGGMSLPLPQEPIDPDTEGAQRLAGGKDKGKGRGQETARSCALTPAPGRPDLEVEVDTASGDDSAVETMIANTPGDSRSSKIASNRVAAQARVLVPSSSPPSKSKRPIPGAETETIEAPITVKPSKRRKVVPDSIVPETAEKSSAADSNVIQQASGSDEAAESSSVEQSTVNSKGGLKGKAKGVTAAAAEVGKIGKPEAPPTKGKGRGTGKGKGKKDTAANPAPAPKRTSLFMPDFGIFSQSSQSREPADATKGKTAARTRVQGPMTLAQVAKDVGDRSEEAEVNAANSGEASPSADTSSGSSATLHTNHLKPSTSSSSSKKVKLFPTNPSSAFKPPQRPSIPTTLQTSSTTKQTHLGTPRRMPSVATPMLGPSKAAAATVTSTTSNVAKAAPIAIKSRSKKTVPGAGPGGMAGKSLFAPASGLRNGTGE